jgi:SAM-dependent methyltransferase
MQMDYRHSHKDKGDNYDADIASTPFDAYMDRWEWHYLSTLLPRIFPSKVPRYLDFACGTGRITHRIEPYAEEAYGIDVSESMLSVARQKCQKTRFECVDLTSAPLDLGVFDLVTAFRFFGNAQQELRVAALQAIARHVRPGGYLVTNNHRNPRDLLHLLHAVTGRGRDTADLTPSLFRRMLRSVGFHVVEQHPIGSWLVRSRLMTAKVLESEWSGRLERLLSHQLLVPLAPDALLVARRITTGGEMPSPTRSSPTRDGAAVAGR